MCDVLGIAKVSGRGPAVNETTAVMEKTRLDSTRLHTCSVGSVGTEAVNETTAVREKTRLHTCSVGSVGTEAVSLNEAVIDPIDRQYHHHFKLYHELNSLYPVSD